MPLGVQFKDSHAKRGAPEPADNISIKQYNRQQIRFRKEGKGFTLELPPLSLDVVSKIRITNRNAIRLARWILEQAELNSGKSSKAVLADEGEKH